MPMQVMGLVKALPPTAMGILLLESLDNTGIGLVGWCSWPSMSWGGGTDATEVCRQLYVP